MPGDDIHVIIVNRDTRDYLNALLTKLAPSAHRNEIGITVVDNDSQDGSASLVSSRFPGVRLIQNKFNTSYGAACNQAAGIRTSRYLVFLNSDVDIDPETILQTVSFMEGDPRIGIAVPVVWTYHRDYGFVSSCLKIPNLLISLMENTLLSRMSHWVRPIVRMREHDWRLWTRKEEPVEIPATPGSIMFTRSRVFNAISGWDPRFIGGYDDIDLCLRIRRTGSVIVRVPGVYATHYFAQGRKRRAELDGSAWRRDTWSHPYAAPSLFLQKHCGWMAGAVFRDLVRADRCVKRVTGLLGRYMDRPDSDETAPAQLPIHDPVPGGRYFIEISLSRSFLVSMAAQFEGTVYQLPPSLPAQLLHRKHYARIFPDTPSEIPPSPIWSGSFHPYRFISGDDMARDKK